MGGAGTATAKTIMAKQHVIEIVSVFKDEASKGISSLGGDLLNLDSIGSLVAGSGIAAIGGALVGIGAAAVQLSADITDSSQKMQVGLGLTDEAAAQYEDTMKSIFANNFGDSFEDIASGIVAVEQSYSRLNQELSQEELQTATENAFRLRDAFGTDVQESINASAELMDRFGLSSQESFDFLTAGMQRGLNSSGDFLDSIGEYATQMQAAGVGAGEFFSLMESGLAGGALGTDKAVDLFKEFRLRITEGGEAARDALAQMGIDLDDVNARIEAGELSFTDLFNMVLEGLRNTEDPSEQFRLGIALMGTQFEDLGTEAVLALDTTKTKIEEVGGATAELDKQYDDLASQWEASSRKMWLALEPLGDALTSVGIQIMEDLTRRIEQATAAIDLFGNAARAAGEWAARLLGFDAPSPPPLPSGFGTPGLPGFAAGTRFLVGEDGMEMMTNQGIFPNDATRSMVVDAQSGGGHVFNIVINGSASRDDVRGGVLDALAMAGA